MGLRLGNWPMLILAYSRTARPDNAFRKSQERVLRAQWEALGELLLQFDPKLDVKPELVFELTYAPAMSFVSRLTSRDLLREALRGLFGRLR